MNRQAEKREMAVDGVEAAVARYGALSGDPAAFADALSRPLSPCVWANPLRLTRNRLVHLLEEENIAAEPVGWTDTGLRLDGACRPGLTWLYRCGLMQIQEESAMSAVRLLAPRPGERVLDLCAGPGNKTAQIAVALGNRGTVVANDRNIGRLAPLHATISRLGLMNITTSGHDGTIYPAMDGVFDKVLVDAPCSGEGALRESAGKSRHVSDRFRRWLAGVQYALLNRAIDLCRPGGRIVYSTCTLAPEENEAIIDRILAARPKDIRVVPATVPGLPGSGGVTRWKGSVFDPAAAHAIRLWPHVAHTSAFFAVLLERSGGPAPAIDAGDPPHGDESARASLEQFARRFGLPGDILANGRPAGDGRHRRWVASDHRLPVGTPAIASGMIATRHNTRYAKLSTAAALAFGAAATRNVIDLNRAEVDIYLERGSLRLAPDRLTACNGPGHVVVRYRAFPLGIAALRGSGSVWVLESLFPKRWG